MVPEYVLRGRHAGHFGQMIDQRADELRTGRPFLDEARKLGVVGLLTGGGRAPREDHERDENEKTRKAPPVGHDRTP